ncbi:Cytochrome P450 CYP72A616 [Linum grandiflorum]
MADHLQLMSILAAMLLLYSTAKLSYSFWWKPKSLERKLKQQGIKGTSYKPLFGDLKDFITCITESWSKPVSLSHRIAGRVDPFTLSIVQKYGNVSMFWFGKTPKVVVMDPDMIQEVVSNKHGHFGKPPLNPLILILARGLTVLEGDEWARHRKIINPAFHLEKLKGMLPGFALSCSNMIEQWTQMVDPQGCCELDVWPQLQKLSMDVISRAAFGSSYEQGKKIFHLQKELILLVMEAMQSFYIPGFRFVPTKKNLRRKALDKEITSLLRGVIEKKQNAIAAAGGDETKTDDLLGILLQSNGLTIEEVIEECKVFYVAGQETTASLLTWTMIVLAMHPDWQEKARQEVLRVCGKIEPSSSEALSHLKIVTMIVNEVLRLYPPAIALYQHTYKETKIGDFCLPAGVDVTLPILLVHHDQKLWGEDADQFRPDRFVQGVAKASEHRLAFFPFGWGPRTCVGQQFATLEVKMALAMILQNFSFELSPSYAHASNTVMLLQPQHGAQLILHKL